MADIKNLAPDGPPQQPRNAAMTLPNHEERMMAAERVAGWHLGSRGWAGLLVGAYLDPEAAIETLKASYDN